MPNGSRNRFIDGHRANKRPVGRCHSGLHPGLLTVKQMKDHGCRQKHCPRFEIFTDHPYWAQMESRRKERYEKRKRYEKQCGIKAQSTMK